MEHGVQTLWVRTNSYGKSLALRFVGMFVFALNLLRPGATRGLEKPDVIVGSTVHPLAAWAGYRLSRRHHVPFVYEIRDVWPESLYELADIGPLHPVARVLSRIDRTLIRHAALVISPLPHVDRHLEEMGFPKKPFLWIANGFELPAEAGNPLPIDGRSFTYMYLGAHGRANALEEILDAFDSACTRAPELRLTLRLIGDGALKEGLIAHAAALPNGSRIEFEDSIPTSEVLDRAREADALIVNLRDLPVYRFGVSLNKYFMYLAAGRPVLSASSAPNNPIREGEAGIVIEAGDSEALSTAIEQLARFPYDVRARLAANGRRELENNYTYDVLTQRLAEGLDWVLSTSTGPRPSVSPKQT